MVKLKLDMSPLKLVKNNKIKELQCSEIRTFIISICDLGPVSDVYVVNYVS